MKDKDFHNLAEVSKNWIRVQEFINRKNKDTFLKTHSALCNINNNEFTNAQNTSALIYVVRDPRNVILSMCNHFSITQEESFKIITNDRNIIYPQTDDGQPIPLTFVGSWNNHYLSWKNYNFNKKIIIKYEDLITNSTKMFTKIIEFLNNNIEIKFNKERIFNSVDATKFINLKKQEDKYGFNMGQKNKFFHLGKENNWQNLLDPKINEKIKKIFKLEMNDLGYI